MLSRPPLSIEPIIMNCSRSSCSCMNKRVHFKYQTLFEAFAIQQEVQAPHSDLHHLIFNLLYSVTGNFPFSTSIKTFAEHSLFTQSISSVHTNVGNRRQNEEVFLSENKKSWLFAFFDLLFTFVRITIRSRHSTAERAIMQHGCHSAHKWTNAHTRAGTL